MVHCGEKWVEMWKKHPEFCDKSRTYAMRIEYWLETCDKIIARGFEPSLVYGNFSENACREIKQQKDPEIRDKALNYVCHCLERNETISGSDLRKSMVIWANCVPIGTEQTSDSDDKCPLTKEYPETPIQPLAERMNRVHLNNPATFDPALADQVRAQEMATATANHINPGASVMINPVIINDTYRQEPTFKTGNEMKMGLMAPERDPKPEDPAKLLRETMEARAEAFIECLSQRQQLIITDILREEPGWKAKDLLAFGIDALDESRKKGRKK